MNSGITASLPFGFVGCPSAGADAGAGEDEKDEGSEVAEAQQRPTMGTTEAACSRRRLRA